MFTWRVLGSGLVLVFCKLRVICVGSFILHRLTCCCRSPRMWWQWLPRSPFVALFPFSFPSIYPAVFPRLPLASSHRLIPSQIKSAIRSIDAPARSRPQPLAAAAIITAAQLQVRHASTRLHQQTAPHRHPLMRFLQEMETENSKLEAEVERMQAVLAADKSMANAAHKALASASDVARSWSENLGILFYIL
jgi:hypothetical protein